MSTHETLSPETGAKTITLLRVDAGGAASRPDCVAIEEPLEIQLNLERRGLRSIKSVSVTMRTPGHDRELAAGFLFTEGILATAEAIEAWETPAQGLPVAIPFDPDASAAAAAQLIGASGHPALEAGAGLGAEIGPCGAQAAEEASRSKGIAPGRPAHGNVLRVVLRSGVEVDLRTLERHFYTTSSCGVCGKTSLEALRVTGRIRLEPDRPVFDASLIGRLPELLRARQVLFAQTGGLHGAGLFDASGRLVAVREDVGRHNAVDKLIGSQFLAGRTPLAGHLLLVSGRASFELMQKSVMAGIPVLAAVGAPSSLAVDLAREFGATLLGFVAPGRFNLYAGAQRIKS